MRRISVRELGYFGEAVVALTAASLAIGMLPFRSLVRLMGRGDPRPLRDRGRLHEVRTAIQRASRRLPWKTVCFQEGLAAYWMLRRRGLPARLHYGILNGPDRLTAHVWVELNGVLVVGEEQPGLDHHRVATFPPPGDGHP